MTQEQGIQKHQQELPIEAIVSTLERIKNEQLNRLIEEMNTLYNSVNDTALSLLLSTEQCTEHTTLREQVRQVREAIHHEWGKRLLGGHRLRFKRLLTELQPQQPGRTIIPYPGRENEEHTSHIWMACINTQRDWTLFRNGLSVDLSGISTLEEVRRYVSERIGEQDWYTEVYAVLEIDAAQLHALVGQVKGTANSNA